MDGLEKKLASADITEKDERVASPASTCDSDTSNESFHSDLGEDRGVPNHHSNIRLSDESSVPEVPIIEPDGKDGTEASGGLSGEKKSSFDAAEEEEDEEDFVDEEYLKDLELSMTEEERQNKREESQKHKENGNACFKKGQYQEAAEAYTTGLRMCPLPYSKDRAILYSNRSAAKAKVGMKKEAIKDCSKAIELNDVYTKAILRRATLNEETDQLDEALKDFQRVLELEPTNQESLAAVRRLPDKINERNEKLKEEMMGKLKDLGNMILRPFGLSTANFELKQDPSSGGYNISFNQNAEKR